MVRLYLYVLFVLLLPITVIGINIELETPLYPNEQSYFKVCTNQETTTNMSCINNLERAPWNKNCDIYLFDYANKICDDIQIKVTNEETITRDIFFDDYKTSLINSINNLPSNDPVSISMKIYGYSLLNNQEKINELIEDLKILRDNDEKCWPGASCDLEQTIEVLYYLSKAGIGKESRVYYDALLWAEFYQNNLINENWKLELESYGTIRRNETINCEVNLDDTNLERFTLTRNQSSKEYIFDYESGRILNITCDGRYRVFLRNYFDDLVMSAWEYADDPIYFYKEGGCWSENKIAWEVEEGKSITKKSIECIPGLTEKALLLNDLSTNAYNQGLIWIENEIDKARIAGKQIKSNTEILNNINAYRVTKDEDVKRWVLFTQNNIGSFGPDHNVFTTLKAIQTFTEDSDREWREDAINWVQNRRTPTGWLSSIDNILAYEVFKSNFHPITTNPTLLYFDDELNFKIQTQQEIEYKIEKELKEKIDITINTETGEGTAKRLEEKDSLISGKILIKTEDRTKKIPIISHKNPEINFLFEENYYFTEDTDIIIVPIEKSASTFNCEVTFTDFFNNKKIKETEDRAFFSYEREQDFNEEVNATITCDVNNETKTKKYSFNVRKKDDPPFSIRAIRPNQDNEPGHIIIRNNIDEEYEVELSWTRNIESFPIPRNLLLDERDLKVFIYQQFEHIMEENTNATMKIKAIGHEKEVNIELQLREEPINFHETHEYINRFSFTPIIITLIILSILAGGYFTYKKYEKESKETRDEEKPKPKPKTTKKKTTKKKPLMDVLIAIDKSLNETDQEITTELEKDGFTKEEIEKALKDFEKYKPKKEKEENN